MNCKLDVCYANVELHRIYTVAQKPVNQLVKCMPQYTAHFFTYWKKGKAVSIHAMTDRVWRDSSNHS